MKAFSSIPPDTIHLAAPENTAKALPFETGATIRPPIKIKEAQCSKAGRIDIAADFGGSDIQAVDFSKIKFSIN